MHFFMEGFEGWVFVEELEAAGMVKRGEVVSTFAQGSEQALMVLDLGSDLAGEFQEVLDDETDDMEAVYDDFGVWEVGGDEAAVRTGEVDTDHAHLFPALEALQIGSQIGFAATRYDIEDAVVFQVGKGGGKTQSFVKAVFVNTQDGGALKTEAFGSLALSELTVDTRDGGRPDPFDPSHGGGWYPLVVLLKDARAEGLGTSSPR